MAMVVRGVRGPILMEEVKLVGLEADLRSIGGRGERSPQVFVGEGKLGKTDKFGMGHVEVEAGSCKL